MKTNRVILIIGSIWLLSGQANAQSRVSTRHSEAPVTLMLEALETLQAGLSDRCARIRVPRGSNGQTLDTATDAALHTLHRLTAGVSAGQSSLERISRWWATTTPALHLRVLCGSYEQFTSILYGALDSSIAKKRLLPEIHAYLVQATSRNVYDDSAAIELLAQRHTQGRVLRTVAIARGELHRYDAMIANLGDMHTGEAGGQRNAQIRALTLKAKIELMQERTAAAAQTLAQIRAWSPTSAADLRVTLDLQRHDTLSAIRDVAFCRLTAFCVSGGDRGFTRDSASEELLGQLYRRHNHGSLEGLDTIRSQAMARPELDLPVPIVPWSPAVPLATPPKTVVVQMITSSTWCSPCASHDLSARGLDHRFGPALIVLAYHYAGPLALPEISTEPGPGGESLLVNTVTRWTDSLKIDTPARVLGCWLVDGLCVADTVDFGGRIAALWEYDAKARAIEARLADAPIVQVTVDTHRDGDQVRATASVTRLTPELPGDVGHPLKLQVMLVEDSIPIVGTGKPFSQHVVRAIAGDASRGFGLPLPLAPAIGAFQTRTTMFNVSQREADAQRRWAIAVKDEMENARRGDILRHAARIDRRQLTVVAFVQDQVTGEILQAAQAKVW